MEGIGVTWREASRGPHPPRWLGVEGEGRGRLTRQCVFSTLENAQPGVMMKKPVSSLFCEMRVALSSPAPAGEATFR